eukprot:TRINITY_DN3890_c0_g1_i1.p1 TRINITY_DN3890_c0_g1~~TRINITY_DN3890_c0_g1_i1.p1  ORF type:complete len:521 (+),score=99.57 TRINITY_DN3890_c0_g1_i1:205-1767(+)
MMRAAFSLLGALTGGNYSNCMCMLVLLMVVVFPDPVVNQRSLVKSMGTLHGKLRADFDDNHVMKTMVQLQDAVSKINEKENETMMAMIQLQEDLEDTNGKDSKEEKGTRDTASRLGDWLSVPSQEADKYCDDVRKRNEMYDREVGKKYYAATERWKVVKDPWLDLVTRMMRPHYRDAHCTVPGWPCSNQFVGVECNIMTATDRTDDLPELIEPSFAILGVQKGGTSTFIAHTREHPHIRNSDKSHFFSYVSFQDAFLEITLDETDRRDGPCLPIAHYMTKMEMRTRTTVDKVRAAAHSLVFGVGDANLFFDGPVAQRVKYFHPRIKMVVLFRNPVTRAWSNWKMKMTLAEQRGGKSPISLKRALKEAKDQTKRMRSALNYCDYNADIESCLQSEDAVKRFRRVSTMIKGLYKLHVANWIRYFPGVENYLFLQSENFATREQECMDMLSDFLHIPRYTFLPDMFEKKNVGVVNAIPKEMEDLLQEFYHSYTLSFFRYLKDERFPHVWMDPKTWGLPWFEGE